MIAILVLLAVIGAIVYTSRRARTNFIVNQQPDGPGETLTFNVRDMSAERKVTGTGEVLARFDLRRDDDGRWELAEITDEAPDARTWLPCDESATSAIELKYRRYNG